MTQAKVIPLFPNARRAWTPEDWLTKAEAARHLRVSRSMIERWMRVGLPCHRDPVRGYVIRFRASEIDAWMEGR